MSLSPLYSPSTYAYTLPRYRGYAPQTPSPLRSSRNANLMPPPLTPDCASRATPESKVLPFSLTTPTSTVSPSSRSDFGSTPRSTSTSGSAAAFQYQSRARSQSPQASLAKSNATVRAHRSSLFLDKVRRKREDLRFETRGEQALRMDFVLERRAWEERLKKRAPSVDIEAYDISMDEADQDVEARDDAVNVENARSSPTEDKEIEELLSYLETDETQPLAYHASNISAVHDSISCHSTLDTISDDEDYDQLFMEVMADDVAKSPIGRSGAHRWYEPQQDQGSSMDLS